MLETAKKWLHKSSWGLIVAYPIVLSAVYLTIWQFAEPLGIPDNLNNLPNFTHYRVFFHLLITFVVTPHIVLVLFLVMRRSEKKSAQLIDISLTHKVTNADKIHFAKFIEEFPPDGATVRFLHEQDIGASFESSRLDQMYNFIYYWHDAAHEFHDKEAERLRAKLYDTLNNFSNKLCQNVSSTHRTGWLSMGIQDFDTRLDLLKEREELNKMALDAYEQYQDIIRLGRRFE